MSDSARPRGWRTLLDAVATIAMATAGVAVGVVVLRTQPSPRRTPVPPPALQTPMPTAPLSLRGAATRGDREAKVAVIEYADFESKSCAQFAVETLPAIDRAYISTGKLLWVFRNRPLTVHPNAEKAAEAAVCAAQQGKMWGMYDLLFADQSHLELQSLYSRARLLSLDGKLFEECLSGRASSVVATDFADGTEAGMNATPGFFVGVLTVTGELAVKKRIRGPQPFSAFQEVLEPLLHSNGG